MSSNPLDARIGRNPVQAGNVKKGECVILKGHPCKIMDIKTSKTGKHGSTKCNMTGVCVLTTQKCMEVYPSSANMITFTPRKLEFVLIDYDAKNDEVSLMDDNSNIIPFSIAESEFKKQIIEFFADQEKPEEERSKRGMELHIFLLTAPVEGGGEDGFTDKTIIAEVKEAQAK